MNLEGLRNRFPPQQLTTDPSLLSQYGRDWLTLWEGRPGAVVFPKSVEDVVYIVQWAGKGRVGLVPSGGRTGLSGGATALNGELAVSFEKMDRILEFNETEKTVVAESGVITRSLQEFALKKGCFFPVSFSAEGSSQIGGNIATNAGGVHVLRYGSMRGVVLGLEAVTGTGEILNLGRGLIKNATGYSLLHLFIGSEGTLGLITKAVIKLLSPPPKDPLVFLFSLENSASLLRLYNLFQNSLRPLAFEVFTDLALEHVINHSQMSFPLKERSPFYILMEVEELDRDTVLSLFERALGEGVVRDGTLSQSPSQARELWKFRENITEALSPHTPYKNDICVRVSRMTEFLEEAETCLKTHYPDFEVVWFGHIGDGNLHINILKPKSLKEERFTKQCEEVNDILFSLVKKYCGTVSAEHGVGLLKKPYLSYCRSPAEISLMRQIKRAFDPKGILNPGKIFDL